jgi:glycosyltransferase involved in cell wall biosynthesis
LNKIIQPPGYRGIEARVGHAMKRIAVVTPVLDDWQSFAILLEQIARHVAPEVEWLEVVAVDDGSSDSFDPSTIAFPESQYIDAIRVVHLALNLGHQRAIAVGLVLLSSRKDLDGVIVMDSDGEDRPEEIPSLLAAARESPDRIILARRSKRSESVTFKAGYAAYQLCFRMLTGRGIAFGNFSVLPLAAVRRLVHMSELWNNLPAAITRSRLKFVQVCTVRGKRYAGQSKMSFPTLVIHGLSAMSVYTDLIFVRVLLISSLISGLSLAAICAVLATRLGTTLAIPGWATTVFGDLVIILFQAILMIVATSLMVLAGRSARPIVPITDAPVYIQGVTEVVSDQQLQLYSVDAE